MALRQVVRTRSTVVENGAITAGLCPPLLFQRSDAARRDSQDFHEYWVSIAKFHSTTSNEIGHVFTDTLDGI